MREWIISISVLIVVTVIIRKLFHKRLKPMWQYLLWLPVLLRLLIPVMGFESSISVFNFVSVNGKTESTYTGQQETEWADKVEHADSLDRTDTTGIVDAAGSTSDAGNVGINSIIDAQEEISGVKAGNVTQQSKKSVLDIGKLLYVIWLSGAGSMALFMLVTNIRYFYKLKTNRTLIKTVYSNRKVYVADNVDTCCMYGLIKPAIYVTPKVAGNEEELIYVISHENTHYKHKDHIWSALRMLCICIHWYNPLVYVAAWLSKQDAEIACDAGAVKSLSEEKRIRYGETLLKLSISGISPEKSVLMATSMSGSGRQLKERLQFIVKKPQAKVFIFLFVMMLIIFVLYITITKAVSEKPANSNSRDEGDTTPWNIAYYSGYMDECTEWYSGNTDESGYYSDHRDFIDRDYDNDGKNDRVYREYIPGTELSEESRYRIELSAGEPVTISSLTNGLPNIIAEDFDNDGENEILFTCNFEFASRPEYEGIDIAFFDKKDGKYERVELPFFRETNKYYVPFEMTEDTNGDVIVSYQLEGEEEQRTTLPQDDIVKSYVGTKENGRVYKIEMPYGMVGKFACYISPFFDYVGELRVDIEYNGSEWLIDDYKYVYQP